MQHRYPLSILAFIFYSSVAISADNYNYHGNLILFKITGTSNNITDDIVDQVIYEIKAQIKNETLAYPSHSIKMIRAKYIPSHGMFSSHAGLGINFIFSDGFHTEFENVIIDRLLRAVGNQCYSLIKHRSYRRLDGWVYHEKSAQWIELFSI